ncbi:MAG: hypothetical protein M1836_003600 [Candelina mexicana]|nr:MAG: hypothetical protein M1836_003600 [Candelina mexicana]
MPNIREKGRMDSFSTHGIKSRIRSQMMRQCSLRFATSTISLAGTIAFAVAISNSPSDPSYQYVFPILSLIISICWNAFNILFFCRADIPIRPAANGVMDLLIWILLVALNVYALVSTNRYGFSRSTSQTSVPSANKYGGAVGSAFVWLAALLHSVMFLQAFLEARRLKRRTVTTIPDATDHENAAQRATQKAQRVSLAKIWLRVATIVISTSGFICFVAAIALNNNWYAIALNIEYWSQGQDTSHLTVALATDYYPLAPFCLSLLIAGIFYSFHYRHTRKPRTTKPLHPICIFIGDLFASILLFCAIILASVVQTYMYYFSFYSGKLCSDSACAQPSYTVNILKIAGISLAVVGMWVLYPSLTTHVAPYQTHVAQLKQARPLHLTLSVLSAIDIHQWLRRRRQAREERLRNQPPPASDSDNANALFPTSSFPTGGRRPSAIETSMKFNRDAMREYDPSANARKESTASFSQMAASLRRGSSSKKISTNDNDGAGRKGSTASFSQMAQNLRRGSRGDTINTGGRKGSNASMIQIAENFRKQGFTNDDSAPCSPTARTARDRQRTKEQPNLTVSETTRDDSPSPTSGLGFGSRERLREEGREERAVRSFVERVEGWRGVGY